MASVVSLTEFERIGTSEQSTTRGVIEVCYQYRNNDRRVFFGCNSPSHRLLKLTWLYILVKLPSPPIGALSHHEADNQDMECHRNIQCILPGRDRGRV